MVVGAAVPRRLLMRCLGNGFKPKSHVVACTFRCPCSTSTSSPTPTPAPPRSSKRRGRKLPPPIQVSDKAVRVIQELMAKREDVLGMRLGMKELEFSIIPTFGYELAGQEEPTDERYEVNGAARPRRRERCIAVQVRWCMWMGEISSSSSELR